MLNLNVVNRNSQWFMAGTERTGQYVVIARTSRGRVGVREFSPGLYRIRVEPNERLNPEGKVFAEMARTLNRDAGWKQPGDSGQQRWSTVAGGPSFFRNVALALTFDAMGVGKGVTRVFVNPDIPGELGWVKGVFDTVGSILGAKLVEVSDPAVEVVDEIFEG